MRRLLSALPLLLAPLAACDAADPASGAPGEGLVIVADPPPAGAPPADPRPYFHDFGVVPVGEVVTHVFRLRNTDPAPVAITRMQPDCGCTRPLVRYVDEAGEVHEGRPGGDPVLTVPPGVEAELLFRIDTALVRRHNVDVLQTVQLATDSPNGRFFRLEAHVFVENPFRVVPDPLDLGRVSRNAGATGRVDVVPVEGLGGRLAGVAEPPADLEVRLLPEDRFGAELWGVEVTLVPPLEPGPFARTVRLAAEGEDGEALRPVELEVRAHVVGDLDWSPRRLVLRDAGDELPSGTVELYPLVAGQRLGLAGARLEGEGSDALELTVAPVEVDPRGRSERWRLSVAARRPAEARLQGEIVVSLDAPWETEVRIPYAVYPR